MATTDHRGDSVLSKLPPHFAPLPTVMRTLAQFDRAKLEGFITVAIGLLDVLDGDPDTETITNVEDEGIDPLLAEGAGPGCPVADGGDAAWIEWHRMRGSQKDGPNLTGNIFGRSGEDDEDDDPAEDDDGGGDCTDDEPGFDGLSRAQANLLGSCDNGGGAGCPLADPGGCEHDGREPDVDAEIETWSCWLDHPPELHIGKRPGWTE